jgi:cell division protein FtsZ
VITVIGVGGAGGNAVNNMIARGLHGVQFVTANTDAQALSQSLSPTIVQLGAQVTRGLGAGADPAVGRAAALETMKDIEKFVEGSHMVFVTAGLGGGTGTGGAPVIASACREKGILTVGVVSKPFNFEGKRRMMVAEEGLRELEGVVDTLLVIPNQNLLSLADASLTFSTAFKKADEVLHAGVRSVTDLIVLPGLINLDFADVRTIMQDGGRTLMGTGEATGADRSREAAENAISNPLLGDISIRGARGVLISISGILPVIFVSPPTSKSFLTVVVSFEITIASSDSYSPQVDKI